MKNPVSNNDESIASRLYTKQIVLTVFGVIVCVSLLGCLIYLWVIVTSTIFSLILLEIFFSLVLISLWLFTIKINKIKKKLQKFKKFGTVD